MASRDINDLVPELAVKAEKLKGLVSVNLGCELLIYCTLRSNAEQESLYALGRTKKGSVVTNARAGQSKHNPDATGKARAFDAVPLINGKPQWNDSDLYAKVGALAESLGLLWAGRWRGSLKETAHFELK